MGKKSKPPKPPDLTPISDAQIKIAKDANDIALKQLGLSQSQFEWFQKNSQEELDLARQQADRMFGFQQKAFDSDQEAKAFAQRVGQKQIDAMDLQMDYAKQDRQRYEDVFLPMQDKFIDEANGYDTPQRREEQAGQAMADVQRQAEAQRANADQRLQSMGIDPSQTRSTSLMNQLGVANAANQALAGNAARQQVEDKGRALRADAINLGMGLPAQATTGFAGAGASGQGAIGAGQASQAAQLGAIQGGAGVAGTALGFRSQALNNVAALTGSPMQWAQMGGNMMGQSMNAYGSAANTMSQNFNNQMSTWQAGQQQAQQNFSNVMSVAGMAAGMMMAEGGAVRAAEGGGPNDLIFEDGSSAPIDKSTSWKDQVRANIRANDSYVRTGQGHGKDGALSMMDRAQNGITAASKASAGSKSKGIDVAPTAMTQAMGSTDMGVDPDAQANGDFRTAFAEGGVEQRIRPRGAIPVRQSRDNIPAWLTEGEYVVPRDVVQAKGIEFFDRLVQKYHRENS